MMKKAPSKSLFAFVHSIKEVKYLFKDFVIIDVISPELDLKTKSVVKIQKEQCILNHPVEE